jgi:hypothetical protein
MCSSSPSVAENARGLIHLTFALPRRARPLNGRNFLLAKYFFLQDVGTPSLEPKRFWYDPTLDSSRGLFWIQLSRRYLKEARTLEALRVGR